MSLPTVNSAQAFWNVSALEAGFLEVSDAMFVADASPDKKTLAPTLSFLLQHSLTSQKFVFDLGIRKDFHNYPPAGAIALKSVAQVPVDVVDSLRKGGIEAKEIDFVCLSHIHLDHIGDTMPFSRCQFIVGSGCRLHLEQGYPDNPAAFIPSDLLPYDRTTFLDPAEWKPVGPFPLALDFFKDGSLYIVDAPGHLPGHINILARNSPDGGWIYLAADSAHYRVLISMEPKIATNLSMGYKVHADDHETVEHIKRIHQLSQSPRVQVLLAHDEPWIHENASAFLPGKVMPLQGDFLVRNGEP